MSLAFVVAVAAAVGTFSPATSSVELCENRDPANAIPACTALIDALDANSRMRTRALFHRGVAFFKTDKREPALRDLSNAIELNPRNVAVYVLRGHVHRANRSIDRAAEDYRTAIKLDHACAPAHVGLGIVLFETGRYDEAIRSLSNAIKLAPRNAKALTQRAVVYLKIGKPHLAEADIARAAQIMPNHDGILRLQQAISGKTVDVTEPVALGK